MTSLLIFGAGSIGNHLANAARKKNWHVTVYDTDYKALERMQKVIYPSRYGEWDKNIVTSPNKEITDQDFDYVFVGTPPDTHLAVSKYVFNKYKSSTVMIEKPLTSPNINDIEHLFKLIQTKPNSNFVGYTHSVSKVINKLENIVRDNKVGSLKTLHVEFKEHWKGIFDAHPWLQGPKDSYLGFWKRGGGALGEHSHALNLWQHISHIFSMGKINSVSSSIEYSKEKDIYYDCESVLNLSTYGGLKGTVIQDVITFPPTKTALIGCENASIKITFNKENNHDALELIHLPNDKKSLYEFPKSRSDDFSKELDHIESFSYNSKISPINIYRGLDTMLVITASHISSKNNSRSVFLDDSQNYSQKAIIY